MATTTIAADKVKIGPTRLLINGEWQDSASGQTFATVNPAT